MSVTLAKEQSRRASTADLLRGRAPMRGLALRSLLLSLGVLLAHRDGWADEKADARPALDHERAGAAKAGTHHPGHLTLTFDGAPDEAVLEALDRHGVTATFFLDLDALAAPRTLELLPVLQDHGHTVGLLVDARAGGRGRIASAVEAAHAAGSPLGVFRSNAAKLTTATAARGLGLTEVGWTIDVTTRSQRRALSRLRATGGIVRFPRQPRLSQVVASFLAELEQRNCGLMAAGGTPVAPVSLLDVVADGVEPGITPEQVQQRAEALRARLVERCRVEATPPPRGDFPVRDRSTGRPRCTANPLAKSCM